MNVNEFVLALSEASGNASDILYELFGERIGSNNAQKQLAGMRKVANKILELNSGNLEIGGIDELTTKPDGTQTSKRMLLLSEEDSKNHIRVMELMGYDPLQWELISCKTRRGYWDVSMKLRQGQDKDGKYLPDIPVKKTNHAFEVIVTVKPIQNILTTQIIKDIFSTLDFPTIENVRSYPKGNCVIEPSILDFHLGKGLSLQEEIKLYKNTVLTVLSKIESYGLKPERFKFQIGQDFIHYDNSNKTTTSGTLIDSNLAPWSEVYKSAVEVLIWTAEQLLCIAPVDFYYVPGNHDKTLSYCLALTLNKVYENNPNVYVDVVDFPRKYWGYSIFAVGMSHGRDEGKRIEDTMQQEAPELWATSQYREYHLGDQHHESSYEKGGIIYRRTSALTELDTWHINKAYKAIRKAPMYVWHENGDKDIIDILVKL